MELKDMVLSTLAELDINEKEEVEQEEIKKEVPKKQESEKKQEIVEEKLTDEKIFLKNVREKTLVLFEGLQSSKNKDIEARLEITLNFLEFLLANIEERLEKK